MDLKMKQLIKKTLLGLCLATASVCSQAEIVLLDTFQWNGNTYHLTSRALISEAQAYAESLGGNVITINSQAENDFINNTWGDGGVSAYAGTTGGLGIGLNDVDDEGNFTWYSGEAFTYNGFHPGEPNNGSDGEDNVVYILGGTNTDRLTHWNDINDIYDRHSIIEIGPMNDVPAPLVMTSLFLVPLLLRRRKSS